MFYVTSLEHRKNRLNNTQTYPPYQNIMTKHLMASTRYLIQQRKGSNNNTRGEDKPHPQAWEFRSP